MILLAKSVITTELDGLRDIQWMPPGTHTIRPTNTEGKIVETKIVVDEEAARVVEQARADCQAKADAGTGDAPFTDFDHLDHDASAWVQSVYWGGDDPKTGGIRLKIEYSADGKAKVEGKSYRRFSPRFQVSDPDSTGICRVIGAGVNMGGLVNKAAFQSIAPLSGKAGEELPSDPTTQTTQQTNTMTEEEIKALKDRLTALEQENSTLKTQLADMQAKSAEDAVEQACEEGKITPDLKASWKESILANPKAVELLAKLPVNPALKQVFDAKDNKDATPSGGKELLAKYGEIKDSTERLSFFLENEKALLAARGK